MAQFHPLAERELVDAARFYEGQAQGLGEAFLDEIERLLSLLKIHPSLGRAVRTVRTLSARRFPYSVVYQVHSDDVRVLAVAHQRRQPKYWAGRVDAP